MPSGFGSAGEQAIVRAGVMIVSTTASCAPGRMSASSTCESCTSATTGVIDLLVVTHEHWDHISGFQHAADVFFEGGLTVKRG